VETDATGIQFLHKAMVRDTALQYMNVNETTVTLEYILIISVAYIVSHCLQNDRYSIQLNAFLSRRSSVSNRV
jgi:hypothetical protein